MKIWLLTPLACVAGIVIGSWGPRAELRARDRRAEMEKARPQTAADGFSAFARMMNIPDEAKRGRPRRGRERPLFAGGANRASAAATNAVPAAVAPVAAASPRSAAAEPATNAGARAWSRVDLRVRLEEAQEIWRTRVDIARAKWKGKLGLDEAGSAAFDAAMDDMNERLHDTVRAFADLLAEKGELTPELGLRLVGDAAAVMAEAYDKVGAALPAARRDDVAGMQVFDFIDPAVAEPLVAVQDKLGAAAWRSGTE